MSLDCAPSSRFHTQSALNSPTTHCSPGILQSHQARSNLILHVSYSPRSAPGEKHRGSLTGLRGPEILTPTSCTSVSEAGNQACLPANRGTWTQSTRENDLGGFLSLQDNLPDSLLRKLNNSSQVNLRLSAEIFDSEIDVSYSLGLWHRETHGLVLLCLNGQT